MNFSYQKNTKNLRLLFLIQHKLVFVILQSVLFVSVMMIFGCAKEDVFDPPIVDILSPTEKEIITLPGDLRIHISFTAEKPIKFIQINILNYNDVPIFEPRQYYPDKMKVEIDEEWRLSRVPKGNYAPFYFQIKVIDGSGTNTFFREINLINPDLKYKGFYLTSRPSVNQTQVDFYNENLEASHFTTIDGEFAASEVSVENDIFYISTIIPPRIQAFEFEDEQLTWTVEPEMPEPKFTDIYFYNEYLYAGTANGRVRSYHATSGMAGSITQKLSDSVPSVITVSESYIVGNFDSQQGSGNALAVFYQETGSLYHIYPMNYDVVDLFLDKYGYSFLIFGNSNDHGVMLVYSPVVNTIRDIYDIVEGQIQKVIKLDKNRFFLVIDNRVYLYSSDSNSSQMLFSFDESFSEMAYESLNSNLFFAFHDRVEIYSFPGLKKIATTTTSTTIKGLNLKYGY